MTLSFTNNKTLVWLARFWGLAALFYWLDQAAWFKATIVAPYAEFSTLITAKILFLLGLECRVNGSMLTLFGRTFVVAGSCTGSFVFLLLAAVIIAFPASFREKLTGLAAGLTTVVLLNLLRTLMIIVLAANFSGSFWSLHIIVGQALMITGTLGVFIWWAQGVGSGLPFLSPSRRFIFQKIALYSCGFIFTYIFYDLFLKSALGSRLQSLIIAHAAAILSLFTDTTQQGEVISTARNSVKVVHACLSSPVLVLFLGTFFILPISRLKRILLYIIGFLPLYYAYNVARIIALVGFLPSGQNFDFSRNFFSQLVVISAELLFSLYYWVGIRRLTSLKKHFATIITATAISIGIAFLTIRLLQNCAIPALFIDAGKTFYNPGRSLSLMPAFLIFPGLFLVLTTPVWSLRQRLGRGLIIYLGFIFFYALIIAALFFLGFKPHPRLLKAINVLIPSISYYLILKYFPYEKNGAGKSSIELPGR